TMRRRVMHFLMDSNWIQQMLRSRTHYGSVLTLAVLIILFVHLMHLFLSC
uniref:Uncharacterized protein n=1 Tax=Aegilops tauschii subsp. strangulata TaxID=200361 RepID=A0A453GIZ4_AEGTS